MTLQYQTPTWRRRLRLLGVWLPFAIAPLLSGCGQTGGGTPGVVLESASTEFTISAEGELVASESLPISLPGSVRMRFNIAWMAPEFSEVKAGDVIARFDDVQIRQDRDVTALNVTKSDFQLADVQRGGEVEKTRIAHDSERVTGERAYTETFAGADERLFSRNELIDALADIDYLDVESAFLAWESNTFDQRISAEENLILAQRDAELSKLRKQETALGMMELRSPADGTFIYARTPWGEKLGKGKAAFPGRPIGQLPVRGKVKARLFVPENDAVGLASGQRVRFRLDADSSRDFTATVTTVSPVASPRNRTDPQKYFSVEAKIDAVDADLMRVGSRLRAEVITHEVDDALVAPAQAVYGDQSNAWVYVVNGSNSSERRSVELGRRSPDRVEITSGVAAGERISLVAPPEETG
ncbi:MAG: HlyD family efflux transporter periplasmic adaptor subunit [Pseudomonadota bacterium]